jgi:hypothetical protein
MKKSKIKLSNTEFYIIGVIIILLIAWGVFTIYGIAMVQNEKDANAISGNHNLGDTLGGIFGPLVGILSSVLVYLTIKEQIKANKIAVDSRNEDNLMKSVKEYMDELKSKFDVIQKKFTTDYGHRSLSQVVRSAGNNLAEIQAIGEELKSEQDPSKRLEMETEMSRLKVVISSTGIEFKEIKAILAYCHFLQDYIISSRGKFLNSEFDVTRFLNLYTSELVTFVSINLRSVCARAEIILPFVDPSERYQWDVSQIAGIAVHILNNHDILEREIGYDFRLYDA